MTFSVRKKLFSQEHLRIFTALPFIQNPILEAWGGKTLEEIQQAQEEAIEKRDGKKLKVVLVFLSLLIVVALALAYAKGLYPNKL